MQIHFNLLEYVDSRIVLLVGVGREEPLPVLGKIMPEVTIALSLRGVQG